ncbi:MAG: hypothetical protein WD037_08075 [Balneolales bacterium]
MNFLRITLLIILILPGVALSQDESLLLDEAFVTDVRQAVDSVYNMNYEASLEILQPWRNEHPNHPVWAFWQALEIWWKILPDIENTDHDDAFFDALDEAKHISDERILGSKDLDALIVNSMSYAFSARHLSNRSSWYRSLLHGRKAMGYFSDVEAMLPELGDLHFGLGMKEYFSAYLRENYPVIRPFAWMLPGGDREGGIDHLQIAAETSTFMIPESIFFLGHIQLHYEENFNQAMVYLTDLTRQYPNNGYYQRLLIRSHERQNNQGRAIQLAGKILSRWEDKNTAADLALKEELHVIRGRFLKFRGQEDQALDDFIAAYRAGEKLNPKDNRYNFIRASYYLGEIYLSRGERGHAAYFLQKVSASNLDNHYVERAKSLLHEEF